MSETGAAKVNTNAGPVWCHYSKTPKTLKLRRFAEGAAFDFDAQADDVDEYVPIAICRKILPGEKSYSIDADNATSVWTQILNTLQMGTFSPTTAVAKASDSRQVVPVTRLRRYYSSMKVFDKALFAGVARFYCENPGSLESLWNDSRKQFAKYNNSDGWMEGTRKELPQAKKLLRNVFTTTEFISYFKENGLPETDLRFVQRELNPWNTRNGIFSTKLPATKTGKGGIDLLMRSREGCPVVGEVKIRNDKNTFFALLQAMTYAVELSTLHQIKRLAKQFPNHFDELRLANMPVEIALIRVNPTDDPTWNYAVGIIHLLNERKRCTNLGKITLYENSDNNWRFFE